MLVAEIRLADARVRQLQAEGGAGLARAHLAFQIGLPADDEVWPEELPAPSVAATTTRSDASLGSGSEDRPELAAARARVEQARAGVRVATSQMAPAAIALSSVSSTLCAVKPISIPKGLLVRLLSIKPS